MAPRTNKTPPVQGGLIGALVQWLIKKEGEFIASLGYKSSYLWALRTIEVLTLVIALVAGAQFVAEGAKPPSTVDTSGKQKKGRKVTVNFRLFQAQYLSVYLVVMLADWLQGTNMYTLYSSYNVDVGTLFLTGFLSSAVFGTFLGAYVDKWGRKLGCIIFCVLEIIINTMEHVPSMPVLMVGRVLGGISTSLLFSAFESWMVTEHRRRGFHEDLLASTFSISSWGSAVSAIIAGFLAQVSADLFGDIGPFQLAIALTCVALVLIVAWWTENYGEDGEGGGEGAEATDATPSGQDGGVSALLRSMLASMTVIWRSPAILYLGLSQAFFEGAVYSFVFMWVPSMQTVFKADAAASGAAPRGAGIEGAAGAALDEFPVGLVFSCFMLAMTLGGMLFGAVLPIFPGGAHGLCILTYLASALAMFTPVVKFSFAWVFGSFLVLEAMVGMFNSCGATLRSQIYPGEKQSSIMSVFRVPLNLLVVLGTNAANSANDVPSMQAVFGLIVIMLLVASHLQVALAAVQGQPPASSSSLPSPQSSQQQLKEERHKGEAPQSSSRPSAQGLLDGMLAKKEKEIINMVRLHVSELVRLEQLVSKQASTISAAATQAQAQEAAASEAGGQ